MHLGVLSNPHARVHLSPPLGRGRYERGSASHVVRLTYIQSRARAEFFNILKHCMSVVGFALP